MIEDLTERVKNCESILSNPKGTIPLYPKMNKGEFNYGLVRQVEDLLEERELARIRDKAMM